MWVFGSMPAEMVELVTVEEQDLLTTPETFVLKEQGEVFCSTVQYL